jgi:hypothetical protein
MDDRALSLWLSLREQADWTARSAALTEAIAAAIPRDRPVSVLDLGTGAGSNLRFLVDYLPRQQRWLLADRSAALLREVVVRTRAWAAQRGYLVAAAGTDGGFSITGPRLDCLVDLRAQDLGTLHDPGLFAGRDLVTASALLDLASEAWLRALASRCRGAGAAALFTLTYDGRSRCAPAEPEDEHVRGLLNEHQRRDKGLGGRAEGPAAAAGVMQCFADEGYHVDSEASDWVLGPGEAAMQRTLIDGWAEAASQAAPGDAGLIVSWRARRLAHVDAGSSHLVIGHRDMAAWRK